MFKLLSFIPTKFITKIYINNSVVRPRQLNVIILLVIHTRLYVLVFSSHISRWLQLNIKRLFDILFIFINNIGNNLYS
nr:MAG TPA: hypothetical protein [Caudoviricetes sp.]